jgi:Helix-turn-helix domain
VASTGDDQLRLVLDLLRESGPEMVTYTDLRAAGVRHPAACVYELELAGHSVERRSNGVRLATGPPKPRPEPKPRVMRLRRD